MSNHIKIDLSDILKKHGVNLENQMNDLIREKANNKELIQLEDAVSKVLSSLVKVVGKKQDLVFSILNLPTKNDLANVGKLAIQTEEKIDRVGEQITEGLEEKENLSIQIQDMKEELTVLKREISDLKELMKGKYVNG